MQDGLDHTLASRGYLRFQQPAKEVGVGPVVGGGLLSERVELGVRRGGADLQEPFGRELFVKGEMAPENWTGGIVKVKPEKRFKPCPRKTDGNSVQNSKPR
jgi:hypothetical protein